MRKILQLITLTAVVIMLAACNSTEYYNVGVSFYPMDELVKLIEDDMKEAGFPINIVHSSDSIVPNHLLKNKDLDVNLVQHELYMDDFNEHNDANLVVIQPIYFATFSIFSSIYESIEDIPTDQEVVITIPNDVTNTRRALHLLYLAELIDLPADKVYNATVEDVLETSRINFKFDLVPLTSLSQRYRETKLGIMYPTYAKDLQLVGDAERIFLEPLTEHTKKFAISAVSRSDNKDSDFINKFIELITQDKVRDYLLENYDWAASPAF